MSIKNRAVGANSVCLKATEALKKDTRKSVFFYVGVGLFSQEAALQLFSARVSLTTVFGMGTGGPSA